MLQKCVSLDPSYTPAYLVLARLASGPATGVLLRHVVRLQPKSPDHLAEYASWLYQNGKTQRTPFPRRISPDSIDITIRRRRKAESVSFPKYTLRCSIPIETTFAVFQVNGFLLSSII